jgi:hypothetical protein
MNMAPETIKGQKSNTYCVIGNEDEGYIEFDLVSFRQKGEERRYAHINLVGFSETESGAEEPSRAYVNLSNKEDFESFKKFISTLNWND